MTGVPSVVNNVFHQITIHELIITSGRVLCCFSLLMMSHQISCLWAILMVKSRTVSECPPPPPTLRITLRTSPFLALVTTGWLDTSTTLASMGPCGARVGYCSLQEFRTLVQGISDNMRMLGIDKSVIYVEISPAISDHFGGPDQLQPYLTLLVSEALECQDLLFFKPYRPKTLQININFSKQ